VASTLREAFPAPVRNPRWATVQLETDDGVYTGRVDLPEGGQLGDLLNEGHPFLELHEVTGSDRVSLALVAVNKRCVRIARLLHESVGGLERCGGGRC
jgi:hypothetical protein